MGMPPVQPSSSHSSQVGMKTSSTQGSIVLASHGHLSSFEALKELRSRIFCVVAEEKPYALRRYFER